MASNLIINQVISSLEGNALINNWIREAAGNQSIDGCFIQQNFYLEGVKVSFEDYTKLISPIGSYQLVVRFGCDPSPEEGEYPFKCIMYTVDKNGKQVGDHFLVQEVLPKAIPATKPKQVSSITGEIPSVLALQWKRNWDNLFYLGSDQPSIHTSLFQVPSGQGTLRGFNYNIIEAVNTLFPKNDVRLQGVDQDDVEIRFLFTNHQTFSLGSRFGLDTFGLLMVAGKYVESQNEREPLFEPLSAFYDLGSPCPNTCP